MAQPTEVETPVKPTENSSIPRRKLIPPRSRPPRVQPFPPASQPHAKIIAIVVVLVLLVGGFFAYGISRPYESTDDAQVDIGHLMPLERAHFRLRD